MEGRKGKETDDKREENGNATGENVIEGRGKGRKNVKGEEKTEERARPGILEKREEKKRARKLEKKLEETTDEKKRFYIFYSSHISTFFNKKLSYHRGTARGVVSVDILPIATQQRRNYLYDKS